MKTKIWEVVLVEDTGNDELLSLAAITKSGIECNVIVKRDGAEAVSHILGDSPQPDLIVLDYHLPKLNGLEVLAELRSASKCRYTPIVMFSNSNGETRMKECYRVGATSCVEKPGFAKDYVDTLSTVIQYWLGANRPAGRDRLPEFTKSKATASDMPMLALSRSE